MWKCKFLRHTFNSKSRVAEEEAARSPEKSNIASSPVSCVLCVPCPSAGHQKFTNMQNAIVQINAISQILKICSI